MKLKLALLACLLACFAIAIVEREEYKNKARFLYGESMGGAVVLYIHWKEPQEWNGAILIAPMCKVGLFRELTYTMCFE